MSAKVNVTLLVVCLCFVTISAEETTEKYTTKYDNINLDDLLKNDRLRRNYVACLLNEGPCTPDAQELKNSLPDAVETDCSKCSPRQKEGSEQVTHYLIDHHPEEWARLAQIYDKSGDYKKNYLESKKATGEETTTGPASGDKDD